MPEPDEAAIAAEAYRLWQAEGAPVWGDARRHWLQAVEILRARARRDAPPVALPSGALARGGGCLCGAVRYELDGEPFLIGVCHCSDCRKESGSSFTTYAKWPREQFRMSGEIATHAGRSFCPACGSRLFNLHDDDVEIRIGSLDEAPSTIGRPSQEGWVKRRETWLTPVAGATQAEQDP